MFQVKALREHLVDQLPDALWELIAAEHPDSAAIRTFLINNIKGCKALNRYYQFDIIAALSAFLEATRCKPTPQTPPTPAAPQLSTPQKTASRFAKLASMWTTFSNWIHHLILKIMGYADEPNLPVTPRAAPYYYTPDVSPSRRATKAPKEHNNPLLMQINTHSSSSTSSNSTHTEAVFPLPIHIKNNTNGISSFKESFTAHFTDEVIKNGDTLSRTFKQLPDYMLLSFERAAPTQAPNGTHLLQNNIEDIEDLDFIFTLPPETLNDQDKKSGIQPKYELQSFICHLGTTTKNGHYVTYIKQSNGNWYVFKDNATPLKCISSHVQAAAKQASLVFYQRTSSSGSSSKKPKKPQNTKQARFFNKEN